MKKKSIQKLSLNKKAVSKLNTDAISGGNGTGTFFCESNGFCETIDYTRCLGEYDCQIYPFPVN